MAQPNAQDLAGTTWQPVQVLDGFGKLIDAGNLPGVAGDRLVSDDIGPDLRPGLYDGPDRRIARNVLGLDMTLEPAIWPARRIDRRKAARQSAFPFLVLTARVAIMHSPDRSGPLISSKCKNRRARTRRQLKPSIAAQWGH